MFSTGKDDWETPQDFYNKLNEEFHFTLDPCADEFNHKCEKYYTEKDDGLKQDWSEETVFVNPPYSTTAQNQWVKKCYEESKKTNTKIVMLLPARTDTSRFHDYILHKAEIRFIRGRLIFEINGNPILDKKGKPQPAPFPCMIAIYN